MSEEVTFNIDIPVKHFTLLIIAIADQYEFYASALAQGASLDKSLEEVQKHLSQAETLKNGFRECLTVLDIDNEGLVEELDKIDARLAEEYKNVIGIENKRKNKKGDNL